MQTWVRAPMLSSNIKWVPMFALTCYEINLRIIIGSISGRSHWEAKSLMLINIQIVKHETRLDLTRRNYWFMLRWWFDSLDLLTLSFRGIYCSHRSAVFFRSWYDAYHVHCWCEIHFSSKHRSKLFRFWFSYFNILVRFVRTPVVNCWLIFYELIPIEIKAVQRCPKLLFN